MHTELARFSMVKSAMHGVSGGGTEMHPQVAVELARY